MSLADPAPSLAPPPIPPASVTKILEGALTMVGNRGARRLSMQDISDAGGVSRGTLYRYFSTKQDVLSAAAEFVCASFEAGIVEAAATRTDPIDKLRAVLGFFAAFTRERSPERILEVEPGFHLDFFRSHFARHKAAVCAALSNTFDHVEARLGRRIARETVSETLVRLQLSTLIVPACDEWTKVWNGAPELLEKWIVETAGRAPE